MGRATGIEPTHPNPPYEGGAGPIPAKVYCEQRTAGKLVYIDQVYMIYPPPPSWGSLAPR